MAPDAKTFLNGISCRESVSGAEGTVEPSFTGDCVASLSNNITMKHWR